MKRRRLSLSALIFLLCIALFAGCSAKKENSTVNTSAEATVSPAASAPASSAKPQQETKSPKPSSSVTPSVTATGTLSDGSYPVYVIGSNVTDGKYYIKFKTIAQYDGIPECLEKVHTAGQLIHDEKLGDYYTADIWDMEKYYDNNYPVTEHRNGKVSQINMQALPGILGISKADLLDKISYYTNDDDNINLFTVVDTKEYDCLIKSSCDIEVSGALAQQAPTTDKLKPDELVTRIDQFIASNGDSNINNVTLEMKNGEIAAFKEIFHP